MARGQPWQHWPHCPGPDEMAVLRTLCGVQSWVSHIAVPLDTQLTVFLGDEDEGTVPHTGETARLRQHSPKHRSVLACTFEGV